MSSPFPLPPQTSQLPLVPPSGSLQEGRDKDAVTKTWKRTNTGTKPPTNIGADTTPTTELGALFRSLPQERLKKKTEQKMVGLKQIGMNPSTYKLRQEQIEGGGTEAGTEEVSVEELEGTARKAAITNPFQLLYLGNLAAFKVFFYYLITLETILTCGLTAALTCYWYYTKQDDTEWQGGGMDFILLAFAVTSPISAAIGMTFQRREGALLAISNFRSFSYHLYMAHCFWDWSEGGRAAAVATLDVDWLEHCDAVLAQLIAMGDELARFLSLPTSSRSRHRMTRSGRREASRTTEVAYYLIDSITTQRMTRLLLYSERLKKIGLPSGEVSRIRQYERFLSDIVEQLRMVKMYRSPQALRSFARIFTFILPPFYAPTFAQVAREVDSIGIGVTFGIITALGLTALFESLQVLEDPFTGYLALDGIDVREEFEVLHFLQLTNTRKLAFPNAPPYPLARRKALTSKGKVISNLGTPPPQSHHRTESKTTIHSMGSLPSLPPLGGEVDDTGAASIGDMAVPLFTEDDRALVDEELGRPREEESSAHLARDSHILIGLQDDPTTRSDDETVHNGRMLRNRSSWSLSRRRMED